MQMHHALGSIPRHLAFERLRPHKIVLRRKVDDSIQAAHEQFKQNQPLTGIGNFIVQKSRQGKKWIENLLGCSGRKYAAAQVAKQVILGQI